MAQLNLSGTMLFKKTKLFHFTIINNCCTEFTPIDSDYTSYPYGCAPDEFSDYKANLVLFLYDRAALLNSQDLKTVGFNDLDISALIAYNGGCSASDAYWVIPD